MTKGSFFRYQPEGVSKEHFVQLVGDGHQIALAIVQVRTGLEQALLQYLLEHGLHLRNVHVGGEEPQILRVARDERVVITLEEVDDRAGHVRPLILADVRYQAKVQEAQRGSDAVDPRCRHVEIACHFGSIHHEKARTSETDAQVDKIGKLNLPRDEQSGRKATTYDSPG
jgi:hypothetical protein